jgi:hypothetical protein
MKKTTKAKAKQRELERIFDKINELLADFRALRKRVAVLEMSELNRQSQENIKAQVWGKL